MREKNWARIWGEIEKGFEVLYYTMKTLCQFKFENSVLEQMFYCLQILFLQLSSLNASQA